MNTEVSALLLFLLLCPLQADCWLLSEKWNGKYPSPNSKCKQNSFHSMCACVACILILMKSFEEEGTLRSYSKSLKQEKGNL